MTPRKIDMTTSALVSNTQEQFEDLATQQLELRTIMDQRHQQMSQDMDRRQAEILQMMYSIKDSLNGMHLHQKSKENSSTSASREISQNVNVSQEILGPSPYTEEEVNSEVIEEVKTDPPPVPIENWNNEEGETSLISFCALTGIQGAA
ncbi:hypothetical protein K7X08_031414 [Anisodus acutangulus]|uniref:Uncharacterized protein n=1 Tax=Anisodus acutangulus TaxID=402998 RepID=A0A9Q1ML24_9SOLA|nr:hypothetical protein K7X08_031414 [Anisodus acutangulus]